MENTPNKIEPRFVIFGGLILVAILIGLGFMIFGGEEAKPPLEIEEVEVETEAPQNSEPLVSEIVPSFDVVRISRGGTGVIAGRATPGSRVELLSDEKVVGHVTADANGEWVLILEEPLQSGPAELTIRTTLGENEPQISAEVVVVSVPDRPDEQFVESEANGVVAVLTSRDGTGASRVLQKPGSQPVGEIGDSLTLDTLDYNADGTAILAGRAVPRANVALYLDNDFIGSTKATEEGRWILEPQDIIADGPHVMRIDQIIGDGDVHLRIEQPFETGLPVDQAMREGKVIVEPGNNLWHIARRVYGEGVRYTLIFQENADQIRDPDLIYPGQQFALPNPEPSENSEENSSN